MRNLVQHGVAPIRLGVAPIRLDTVKIKKIKKSNMRVRFESKKWVIFVNALDRYTIFSLVLIVIDIYILYLFIYYFYVLYIHFYLKILYIYYCILKILKLMYRCSRTVSDMILVLTLVRHNTWPMFFFLFYSFSYIKFNIIGSDRAKKIYRNLLILNK